MLVLFIKQWQKELTLADPFSLTRLDGRNSELVSELADIFCDFNTTKMRVEYELNFLSALNYYLTKDILKFNKLVEEFSLSDYEEIKKIEFLEKYRAKPRNTEF